MESQEQLPEPEMLELNPFLKQVLGLGERTPAETSGES